MVIHSYSRPEEVKCIFLLVYYPLDRHRKLTWKINVSMKHKIDISVFLFADIKVTFFVKIRFFVLTFSTIYQLLGNFKVLGPSCGGRSHDWIRRCQPFWIKNWVSQILFWSISPKYLTVSIVGS